MRKRTPKGVLFLLNGYKNLWERTAYPKNLVTRFARNNEPLLRLRYNARLGDFTIRIAVRLSSCFNHKFHMSQ